MSALSEKGPANNREWPYPEHKRQGVRGERVSPGDGFIRSSVTAKIRMCQVNGAPRQLNVVPERLHALPQQLNSVPEQLFFGLLQLNSLPAQLKGRLS